MKKAVTVLIADDHPIFRRGLREVIEEDASVKLLGEAHHGQGALQFIQDFKPQVAVLDHDMPQLNGLQVARAVRQRKLSTALVMLTMFKEERLFNEAMDAGFLGYVLKENAAQDLLECIHAVADGKAFITPSLARVRGNGLLSYHPAGVGAWAGDQGLSPRPRSTRTIRWSCSTPTGDRWPQRPEGAVAAAPRPAASVPEEGPADRSDLR
jgi:DNA-binding NarL/FixJ family response regulator